MSFHMEKLTSCLVFLSLACILAYLALAVEICRGTLCFFAPLPNCSALIAERAMMGLLLTAILGFGLDMYLKKVRCDTKN